MQPKTHFQKILSLLLMWVIICTVTYLFLSLCNWDINIKGWNGFSRFLLGAEGVIFIFDLMNEL
jgi:hypothetical protein